MQKSRYIVIKIGGRPANNPTVLDSLIAEIGKLKKSDSEETGAVSFLPVLVHGGGADVTELSARLGIVPNFVNGKRQTSAEEMQIVEAVLAGNVNSRILRRFLAAKVKAIGLSGVDDGLFTAVSIDSASHSRTGEITQTNPQPLIDLLNLGYVPIVSSVSCDRDGQGGFNINADDVAMALAVALQAHCLIFLSDIEGILKNGEVIRQVSPSVAEAEIGAGVISGGMIPKVRSSLGAVKDGVGTVVIGGYQNPGDLQAFLDAKLGTSMVEA